MRKKLEIRYKEEKFSVTISLLDNKDWKKLYTFLKGNWLINSKMKFADWKKSVISEKILRYECNSKSAYDVLILRIKNLKF